MLSKFIETNAMHIEETFRKIHQPKEFSDIRIQDGEIRFTRNSNPREEVTGNEISTGQCIALYTAVLLTMFRASRNRPNFLIFDEPVANLDDLHLLSLIDIVRDYALDGVQIFFTTANPDIAKIFRRKFSFMEKDFKTFEFIRYDNSPAEISVRTFLPNSEESLITE